MQPEVQIQNRRLDSWKEIAAFFGRDESTVKRWEKERALRIHRLPGSSRSRVFAFTEDLTTWMQSRNASGAALDQEAATIATDVPSRSGTIAADIPEAPQQPAGTITPRSAPHTGRRRILVALCILTAAIGLTLWVLPPRRNSAGRVSPASTTMPSHASAATQVNPEAQELYLEGRYYWNKRTPDDLTKAVDYFTQAIVKDPNYALAYVGLADSYNLLREFSAMPSAEAFARALAAAKKAVELDDSSAEAHASLALPMFYWKWDAVVAEHEFRRAIDLNPNYIPAHHWYATFLMALGRFPEALEQIDWAQKIDPASTPILADKALLLFHQGNQEEAIALLKQIEASQPSFFSTHQHLAYIYLTQRDYPSYLAEATKAATAAHDERRLAIVRAAERGFKSGGERGLLEDTLQIQTKFYKQAQISAFSVAETCARLGEKEEALRYLQASYDQHDPTLLSIRVDRAFVDLHADPAFSKLVTEAGLPPLP